MPGGFQKHHYIHSLAQRLHDKVQPPLPLFRLLNRKKEHFECPICFYQGPFADLHGFAGLRKHASCPKCGALERHRLQYLAVSALLKQMDSQKLRMLHVAPEPFFVRMFSRRFGRYETADLCMKGVSYKADLRNLPFDEGTYDVVYASHVLEHIADDKRAIEEIWRVLKPNGVAVLPVPVVCEKTIEYPEANPNEAGHVRAPGLDYFEKYKEFFEVRIYASDSFLEKYQLFVYEDRTVWPTKECPLRPPMLGSKHLDFVPICFKRRPD
jgi:SAM-dependent methyltransferase